jgi:beta-carotene hydroxylase
VKLFRDMAKSISDISIAKVTGPIPNIAWPTILLLLASYGGIVSSIYLFRSHIISLLQMGTINTVMIFLMFTPMHDAAHGSIATVNSGCRWLNDFVGIVCGLAFPSPFPAFKYIHLQHHHHTNDPDKDPDYWTAQGPWYLLPFHWITIEIIYYKIYLPILFQRPAFECFSSLLLITVSIFSVYFGLSHHREIAIWGWLVPGRIALAMLACTFDYLPHRPHSATRWENSIAATSVTALYGDCTWLLTWPLLFQNYHNIHHHWPFIPFYMYAKVWHAIKTDLMEMGQLVIPIIPIGGGKITKARNLSKVE